MRAIPPKSNGFRLSSRPKVKPFVGLLPQVIENAGIFQKVSGPAGPLTNLVRGGLAPAPGHDRVGQMDPAAGERMSLRSRPLEVGMFGMLAHGFITGRLRVTVRGFRFC